MNKRLLVGVVLFSVCLIYVRMQLVGMERGGGAQSCTGDTALEEMTYLGQFLSKKLYDQLVDIQGPILHKIFPSYGSDTAILNPEGIWIYIERPIMFFTYNKMGTEIVTLSENKLVELWDISGNAAQLKAELKLNDALQVLIPFMAFSDDGKKIIMVHGCVPSGVCVSIWDANTGSFMNSKPSSMWSIEDMKTTWGQTIDDYLCSLMQAVKKDTVTIALLNKFNILLAKNPQGRIQATLADWQAFNGLPDFVKDMLRAHMPIK